MKLTKADVVALEFSIGVLEEIAKQTIKPEQRGVVRNNIARLRSIRIAIIIGINEGLLDFDRLVHDGIPESNPALIAFRKMWNTVDKMDAPSIT